MKNKFLRKNCDAPRAYQKLVDCVAALRSGARTVQEIEDYICQAEWKRTLAACKEQQVCALSLLGDE